MGLIEAYQRVEELGNQAAEYVGGQLGQGASAVAGAAAASFCNAVGAGAAYTPGTPGAFLQGASEAACGPYYQGAGYTPPGSELPFTGGQCATDYEVVAFGGSCSPSGNQTPNGRVLGPFQGPISSVIFEVVGDNSVTGCVNQKEFLLTVQGAGGSSSVTTFGVPPITFNLVRAGGGPDNCGDPPPVFVPYDGPPPDQPVCTGDYCVVIENPTGDISIGPQFDVDISGPDAPDDPVPGVGNGNDPETEDPDSGVEGTERGPGDSDGDGDTPFGTPPPGYSWAGFRLVVTGASPGRQPIPGSESRPIYPEIVANARIVYRTDQGQKYTSPNHRVRESTAAFLRPTAGHEVYGANVVVPWPHLNWSVYPVAVRLEEQPEQV